MLLTYLVLSDSAIGAYSASSVFPKGILVVVTPVLQMLYPTMVGRDKVALPHNRIILQKCAGVIFLLSGAIGFGVFQFSGLLCGGTWGFKIVPTGSADIFVDFRRLTFRSAGVGILSIGERAGLDVDFHADSCRGICMDRGSVWHVQSRRSPCEFTVFSAVLLVYYSALSLAAERR